MKKRTKLTTALLLAVAVNSSYATERCFPPVGEIPTLPEVLECFQNVVDTLQKRVAELEKYQQEQEMLSKAMIVYNSVANEAGENAPGDANTLTFWQIPYEDRFKVKGVPDLRFNYYNPTLYQRGTATYIDVVEDLDGKVAVLMKATAEGIDPKTMKMINPKFLEGDKGVFQRQFASGWSSDDYDGDTADINCAARYAKVTQHYHGCWYYNLGSDAESPFQDKHWGPHLYDTPVQSLNLKTDGSSFTRVLRITRYVIF